jgi:hypothetical protein
MFVHTSKEKVDLTKYWSQLRDEVSLLDPDGTLAPGQSSFGHIVGYALVPHPPTCPCLLLHS